MPSTRQETPIEFVGSTSAQAGVPAAGNRLVFADSADSAKLKIKKSDATLISLEDPAAPAAGSITYAQIQDVSATDKVLGRSTAGAGDIEEIPCTAAGRALLDDVAASDQRTTLGLGALAVKSTVIAGDFGAGAIVNADINAAAAIALSKLASDPLARANHTGTQLAATISDFDSAADARINLRTAKSAVRAATPAPGTLASSFENGDVIDGITLATGDRILLKSQTTTSENGIYTVNASGAPTRATDADISAEVIPGMAVHVREGTANADTTWVLTTDAPITLDTTGLTFVRSGANAATLGGQSGSYYLARANHSGTQSLATLSTDPLARANHTGTQLAATIANFDTQVRTSKLEQMASPATGQVLFSNGTVGTPGIAFGIDTDSGFYNVAGDQIAASLGGVARLYLTTNTHRLGAGIKVEWSATDDASAATDTNLYRSAADVLKTDDAFVAALGLSVLAGAVTLPAASVANAALTTNPLARANHTGTQLASTVSDFTAAVLLVAEHALVMGLAGAIPAATTNDVADFLVVVPFNMTLLRIKASCKTAVTADSTFQIRRSTDSGATFSDAFGTVQILNTAKMGVSDPSNLNVNEGDILNVSKTIGAASGTNLLVEVIGIAR